MAREREASVVDKVNPVPKLVRIRVERAGPKPLWIRARVNEIQTREQDAGRAWDARLRWRQGSMCVIFRTDPRHVHGMAVFRRRDGKCLEWMHVDSSAHSGMRTELHGGSAAGRVGECAPRDVARRRENHAPAGTHVLAADDTNTDGKRVMGVSMIGTETTTIPGGIVSEEPTRMRLRSHDRTEAHSRAKAPISVHIGRDPSSRLTVSPRIQRHDGNRSKERWMRRSSVNRQPHPAAVPVLRTVCKLLERQSTSAAHEDLVQFLSTLRVQLEKHSQERASSEPFDVERLKHELLVTRLALLELMKPANSNATPGTARCPPPMREHNDESAPRAQHSPALVSAVFSYVRCLKMHAASSGMDRPVESTAQALGLVAQDTTRLIHEMQIRAAGANPLGGSVPVSKLLPVNSSMSQLGQLIFSQTQLLASMRKERLRRN
ncbi:hypothetical protein F1559_003654 [Cyanidiococcus yangmingshanensis]|uniref:Uncharacterized protein n=1 Tax=Cyanidiococcus yangmingshanensis TaxID=2690220 RepID=A0A7J7IEI8_9RHOD|nr:hypothetical protein F1559_003654 [Cyanidiococcus yangmingshanensis]